MFTSISLAVTDLKRKRLCPQGIPAITTRRVVRFDKFLSKNIDLNVFFYTHSQVYITTVRPRLLFCSTTYPSLFYKFTQPPQPYSFGYDNTDEFGTQTYHKEQGDASNTKTGSYGYRDAYGIFRRVNYVADVNGFRATIDTNEPGTAPGRSADAVFNANPVAAPVAAKSASASASAVGVGSGCRLPGRTSPPQPYSFGYDNTDEFGTQTYHKEQGDASNTKTGSYGYRDAYGIFRRVNYVADVKRISRLHRDQRARNRAGRSADAVFNANPVAAPVAAKAASASASAPFAAYLPAPAYGTGYTSHAAHAPWSG
ncbi:hypothetical protein HPB48_021436 [Haemaphysalis longicornis]|uniref:Cuticle protein n=1 Tax=Haemaphysalis longicornis TaxID=44386 RepID=A0A9J6G9R5_HAELO|nr:hypothetical protein HPB48_021436 [Haemaphysalis longicornis]